MAAKLFPACASAEVTADNWTNGIWSQFWRDLHPTEEEMHAMRMADIIIFGIFGNTGWELFQNFFYRLYRLSPSVNV